MSKLAAVLTAGGLFVGTDVTTADWSVITQDWLIRGIVSCNPKLKPVTAVNIAYTIRKYAIAKAVDPALIAAVMAAESTFKSKARGSKGELGLMQLLPKYHGVHADDDSNIEAGIDYLSGLQKVFKTRYRGLRWVEHYNRGPGAHPKSFPYYTRVMAFYKVFGGTDEHYSANAGAKRGHKGYRDGAAPRTETWKVRRTLVKNRDNT